jgi:3-carboxy-cis,cis-muconate cycloisomerase
MRANLDAAHGLPLAEHLATLLSPALGPLPAHDLIARAAARATADSIDLSEALLADPKSAATLTTAGITRDDLESALQPESYLGATQHFITTALTSHADSNATLNS